MISTARVPIYVRISTDKQDAENKLHDLKSYCDRIGYEDVTVYSDTISGSKSDLKHFVSMMNDVRLRK
jgi:DNA invertase Pin-like site-specific DNA recombinase